MIKQTKGDMELTYSTQYKVLQLTSFQSISHTPYIYIYIYSYIYIVHEDIIWRLDWNPSNLTLASCSSDQKVGISLFTTDPPSEKSPSTQYLPKVHTKSIRSLAWNTEGNKLATVSFDSSTHIWVLTLDPNTLKYTFQFATQLESHESEIKNVAWSPDSQFLATCGRDKTIYVDIYIYIYRFGDVKKRKY